MRLSKNEGLGVEFQIPDISQEDLEQFLALGRELERQYKVAQEDAKHGLADVIGAAVRTILRENVRPTTPEFSGRMLALADTALRMAAQSAPDELTQRERDGLNARAAARLGWLGEIGEKQIAESSPALTSFVILEIGKAFREATEIPPN